MAAEEQETHVHGRIYHFEHQQSEVQNLNPNPKFLFNARGNPYLEGDPNLGYSLEDSKPRYATPNLHSGAVPTTVSSPRISPDTIPVPKPQYPQAQHHQFTSKDQHHQLNSIPITGQSKPKPKNWAFLLQSQSPSLDMKLNHFPDL